MMTFWNLIQNDEDVLLFLIIRQAQYHLTETHEHNFEIHNIALSSLQYLLSFSDLSLW